MPPSAIVAIVPWHYKIAHEKSCNISHIIILTAIRLQGEYQSNSLSSGTIWRTFWIIHRSLIVAEPSNSVKKLLADEFVIPKRIFLPNDPVSGVEDNLVVKWWQFV
ncbi:hypothetical protein GQX73_g4952 [Xylaria multiplex]|uniref:Uncharacterized protein n=1 Tax=Xylaria multiplex TaxID=323545 RepID=A0A7C8ITD2_9PEZI|nr:hypothetical protein GQX73_g4952 [Xylaria multiplex]